ncbi:MAG: hypothetical protein K9I95_11570 [Flavobacteriaceae bacterium]|nr:hypothetical protein [Flavobacteriaceae bacterium]
MKTKFHLIAFLLIINVTSCKKEKTFTEFEFTEKPIALICENTNSKLYNEALYSFENDILNFYGKNNKNLLSAYSQFIRLAVYNTANYKGIASEHTLKVFEALKNDSELWDANNTKSHLNYKSDLMTCISQNIANKDLKTTLNALLSTNSMSPKLFGTPLATNYSLALSDKYLASYVAFDLFYAKLFDVDFSIIEKEKPKVDFNLTK